MKPCTRCRRNKPDALFIQRYRNGKEVEFKTCAECRRVSLDAVRRRRDTPQTVPPPYNPTDNKLVQAYWALGIYSKEAAYAEAQRRFGPVSVQDIFRMAGRKLKAYGQLPNNWPVSVD